MIKAKTHIQSIRLQDFSICYEGDAPLVNHVNVELPMDGVSWITGSSGSGKSTFLKVLAGLNQNYTGNFLINDDNIKDLSFDDFLKYRLNMGYSFDYGGLLNNKTIFDNLALPLQYHNLLTEEEIGKRVTDYLEVFNLLEFSEKRPAMIPGGMRKAACIARAFVGNPELVLLDDPTTGLSLTIRENLKEFLQHQVQQGRIKTLYVVTEDRNFMEHFNPSKILIKNNRLLALHSSHLQKKRDAS